MMESNAAVTEALVDFIARVEREKHVLALFCMSLHPTYLQVWAEEPQLPCSQFLDRQALVSCLLQQIYNYSS